MLNDDITLIGIQDQNENDLINLPYKFYLGNSPSELNTISNTVLQEPGIKTRILWVPDVVGDFDEEELLSTGVYCKITRDNTFSQIACFHYNEVEGTFVPDFNSSKFNGYEFNLAQVGSLMAIYCSDPTVQITSLTKGVVWKKEVFTGGTEGWWGAPEWCFPPSMWSAQAQLTNVTPDYYPLKSFCSHLADEINFNNERYSSHMFGAGCPMVSGVKHISWKDIEEIFLRYRREFPGITTKWYIHRAKLTHPDGYTQRITLKLLTFIPLPVS